MLKLFGRSGAWSIRAIQKYTMRRQAFRSKAFKDLAHCFSFLSLLRIMLKKHFFKRIFVAIPNASTHQILCKNP